MVATSGSAGSLTWRLDTTESGHRRLSLRGEIDENADLEPLLALMRDDVELDLADIRRINSCGVRVWVRFMRDLDDALRVTLSRCAPPVVDQLNTISNFRGRAEVASFLAPYICQSCQVEELRLLDVRSHFPPPSLNLSVAAPAFPCEKCGGVLVLDELPERYLAFLVDVQTPAMVSR